MAAVEKQCRSVEIAGGRQSLAHQVHQTRDRVDARFVNCQGSCDRRIKASPVVAGGHLDDPTAAQRQPGDGVVSEPQGSPHQHVHLRASPHRGRDQHVAVHRRRMGLGRQDHQGRGAHALGHQDQPGVRIPGPQQPDHDADIAGEGVGPGP